MTNEERARILEERARILAYANPRQALLLRAEAARVRVLD
jgi:hypothetical protein